MFVIRLAAVGVAVGFAIVKSRIGHKIQDNKLEEALAPAAEDLVSVATIESDIPVEEEVAAAPEAVILPIEAVELVSAVAEPAPLMDSVVMPPTPLMTTEAPSQAETPIEEEEPAVEATPVEVAPISESLIKEDTEAVTEDAALPAAVDEAIEETTIEEAPAAIEVVEEVEEVVAATPKPAAAVEAAEPVPAPKAMAFKPPVFAAGLLDTTRSEVDDTGALLTSRTDNSSGPTPRGSMGKSSLSRFKSKFKDLKKRMSLSPRSAAAAASASSEWDSGSENTGSPRIQADGLTSAREKSVTSRLSARRA